MIELLLLGGLAVLAWKLIGPNSRFATGFASLLDRPLIARRGLGALLRGVEQVGGEYDGRHVVLVLHRKRDENLGYLVVGMEARGVVSRADTGGALRVDVQDRSGRDALHDLEVRYDLRLSLAEGWLRATWAPIGFFIFPGRFDTDRWRGALDAMRRVVASLEDRAAMAPPPASAR